MTIDKELKCPVCKSTHIAHVEQRADNNVYGPGFRSWIINEYDLCRDCGNMFKQPNDITNIHNILNISKTEFLYIRFGNIPEGECSKIWMDGQVVGEEQGVSVYEAVKRNIGGKDTIHVLYPNLSYNTCVSMSGCINRPVFHVTGDLVGYGSDGEPLLKNVQIVKQVYFNN